MTGSLYQNGGTIQQFPKVYIVFWGWHGSDPSGEAAYLKKFFNGVGGSGWGNILDQYYDYVRGYITDAPSELKGTWYDDNSTPPSGASWAQLANEALAAETHFGYDKDADYFVATPSGHSASGFGTQYCAWHDETTDSQARNVAFTNFPYITDAGASCGQNFVNSGAAGTLDGVSIVAGHEYAEAATDPYLSAWFDVNGYEIGDKCAWVTPGSSGGAGNVALSTGTFAVQTLWSNYDNWCEISYDGPPPPPTNVTAATGANQLTISWQAPGGVAVTGYKLYRGTSSGSESLYQTLGLQTSYVDTGLPNGSTYWYYLTTIAGPKGGFASREATARTFGPPLTSPTITSLTLPVFNTVRLAWTPPAPNPSAPPVNAYWVYRGSARSPSAPTPPFALYAKLGNVTQFNDTSLQGSTTYGYQIVGLNIYGASPLSPASYITLGNLGPAPPGNVASAPGPGLGNITVTWSPPTNTTLGGPPVGYDVYQTNTGGSPKLVATVGNVTTTLVTGFANGAPVTVGVASVNATGAIGPLGNLTTTTTFATPSAPLAPTLTPGLNQLAFAWGPPVSNGGSTILSYRIYAVTSLGKTFLHAVCGTTTSDLETGLTTNATYTYAVSAVNEWGEGPTASNSGTTFGVPYPPTSVTAASGPNPGEISLRWNAPRSNGRTAITSYTVYQVAASGAHNVHGFTNASTFLFTDSGLSANTSYQYVVTATNRIGEGSGSAPAKALTFAPPGTPLSLSAATGPGAGEITVSWTPPKSNGGTAVTGYDLFASNTSGGESHLVSTSGLTYLDQGLVAGQVRFYEVRAENAVGAGFLTRPISQTTAQKPGPPFLVEAADSSRTGNQLTWYPPPNSAKAFISSYNVYRSVDGVPVSFYESVQGHQYDDVLCPLSHTCIYVVTAVGIAGEGARSIGVSDTGKSSMVPIPGTPTNDTNQTVRLIGHERLDLAMDARDANLPAPGYTWDSSPYGNHGQLVGGDIFQDVGVHGQGYHLGGTSGITLNDAETSDMSQGTLMMWVQFDNLDSNPLFGKYEPGINSELALSVGTDGNVAFSTSQSGGPTLQGATTQYLSTGPGRITTGIWYHIAASWGPAGKRIFIDGVPVASDVDPVGVGELSTVTSIGLDVNSGRGMTGTIDDVRLYDVALPTGLIQSVAAHPYVKTAAPIALHPPASPLAGPVAADSASGTGGSGMVSGAASGAASVPPPALPRDPESVESVGWAAYIGSEAHGSPNVEAHGTLVWSVTPVAITPASRWLLP
ncbi:MAG: fibronectin type III domain-containing protein [Thermoplasmatota archaeon]